MASIIRGDRHVFNALSSFSAPSDRGYEFMASTSERFRSSVDRSATEFFERSRQQFRRVDRDELARRAKAALGNEVSHWTNRVISTLSTVEEFQNAPPSMIPSIMANPGIRRLYLRGRCEGYGEHYENLHGNRIKHQHADYQRVMSGVWHDDDEDGYACTVYDTAIEEPTFTLSLRDTNHVRRSWEALERMIDEGLDDPTSLYNSRL